MADNAIEAYNPATGELKLLTSGELPVPAGLKLDGASLWVADVFGFRQVNAQSGDVKDVFRMQASDLDYPFAVGVSTKQFALASWFTGMVQIVDRAALKTVHMIHGLKAPFDALPMEDGSVLYAEIATGSITRARGADYKTTKVVAEGLGGPVQMTLGRDGALYVTEAAGKPTRIDLATGAKTEIANGLAMPEGVAQTPWGSFIDAETAAAR
jgi:streptogramin lyase